MSSQFLSAEWQYLAMLNYEIDPHLLLAHVPRGTELDNWNGKVFVSMVGFSFLRTRVWRMPVPFHRDFEEVNLRFYVRRKAEEGWRRGVVFVKEIVPHVMTAAVARGLYNENYVAMPMRHRVEVDQGLDTPKVFVEYMWRFKGHWNHLSVETAGPSEKPAPGSLEEFITEHYWGYVRQRDGGCLEYRVEHPPWSVWQAGRCSLHCDAAELYGEALAGALTRAPSSAFLATGSPVIVRKGQRL